MLRLFSKFSANRYFPMDLHPKTQLTTKDTDKNVTSALEKMLILISNYLYFGADIICVFLFPYICIPLLVIYMFGIFLCTPYKK